MYKIIFLILSTFMMLSFQFVVKAASINPDNLVKVTTENDAKCVEYYSYQNEIYCSTNALDTKPVDTKLKDYERLAIVFDNRPWKLAWGKNESTITTIEYVPNGEDINNWNELVTSQFFPGLQEKVTPKQFVELFLQELKAGGYQPMITYHHESENLVIFEFRIDKPANQQQDELQMVTKDNKGLYSLHYVIKKSDMGKEKRIKWKQNLLNSKIKNNDIKN